MKIKRLLIANRGEIARRIILSAKEMGIDTIAVYSDTDRGAPHVIDADEAAYIGPDPASTSYLNMDRIIETAKGLNVDAIHPGYGFLSENAEFARRVIAANIIFVGPSPEAIQLMGSKLAAKQAVATAGIPLVPGTDHPILDKTLAKKTAMDIGFPILIKASAGGGGKGMRIVRHEGEFDEQLDRAVSEALSAFGDPAVFLERYIDAPKHIEIQVLADNHGNVLHLFERECSIQRRHQKVIEEAPSAVVTAELREQMGEAAVQVAKSCQYSGAGTVEFLVDEKLNFYFLEMNTRLQVEHPVTEWITGLDLVKEQIRIAEGARLPFGQEDLSINGHAIEARIYAEDPDNQFLPDTGTLDVYIPPKGPGIRMDDGFEQGMAIPVFYDPMIGKLSVHAPTRQEAIEKMKHALLQFKISGVKTTIPFCAMVMTHPEFTSGRFTTKFVETQNLTLTEAWTAEEKNVLAAFAVHFVGTEQPKALEPSRKHTTSKWKTRSKF